MPLSDLIDQVPRLLELMPSECLAALVATSTSHRGQIHKYVTRITISDPTHASDLVSCSWSRLIKWTLADQDAYMMQTIHIQCDTTVATASVLAKASLVCKWQLQLEGIHLSAAVAAEIAKADWPSLVGLYFGRAKLTRAVVQELVAANWPALTMLSSFEMPVDMDILTLLSLALWPQLAFLILLNVRLLATQPGKEQELRMLSALSNAWSKVVSDVDQGQTSSGSSATSATLDWSSIITLTLAYQQVDTQMVTKLLHTGVNRVDVLSFNSVQLDAATILQLTKSECPMLWSVTLSYNGLGSVAVSYLAQGKWPLLEELSLEGNTLEDSAVDELFTGKWQELRLTVRSLHGKAITKWLGLSSDSVQEALRQPEQDVQASELEVNFSANNADMQPPLQHIRDVYTRLATVTLYPPRPLAT